MPLKLRLTIAVSIIVAAAVLFALVFASMRSPQLSKLAIAMIWMGAVLPALALVYAVLAYGLRPLEDMARVAQEEDPSEHLAGNPLPPELAAIAARVNHLLVELAEARSANTQLRGEISQTREDERRRIGDEFHDEAGPCLFGITANLSSIRRLADDVPETQAERLRQRLGEIDAIAARLKTFSRDMLRKLRPVQLGQLPLSDVVEGLIAGFRRQHPDVVFTLDAGALADSYGENVDLAIYRAAQEGITNALRHGGATRVGIDLRGSISQTSGSGDVGTSQLRLTVQDNGRGGASGASAGIGLTAMRERVRSLGGSVEIDNAAAGGSILTVMIPMPVASTDT